MSVFPMLSGRVAQCLRVLRFARIDLVDGRIAVLYVHHGEVVPGDEIAGTTLDTRGSGDAHNLTSGTRLRVEVIRVMEQGAVPDLTESLIFG